MARKTERTDEGADDLILSADELRVRRVEEEAGRLRTSKRIESVPVERTIDRKIEQASMDREAPLEGDSGEIETLEDGSISIPVFEEQLVIEKRLVVRERVIIRKLTVTQQQHVQADLRREHLDVEADADIADRVSGELLDRDVGDRATERTRD